MKNNKNIHDEDYDFSIKLIVPLLSILVCTICLCATTWAWYTASVSTGVTSIKAAASVREIVTLPDGTKIRNDDGVYTLTNDAEQDVVFKISFDSGEAYNGYFAEIIIEDIHEPENIINLFVNRVYAEDVTSGNFYYYIGKNNVSGENDQYVLSLTLKPGVSKLLKIKYTWAKNESGNPVYSGNILEITPINDNSLSITNSTSSYSLRTEENMDEIPTYKYSVRFIDNKTYEELRPEISKETIYETVLVGDYQIEGYEVLSDSYDKIDEEGIYFYIDTEKEINKFVVLYEKIHDSDGEQMANNESYTQTDIDATPGDTNNNKSIDGSVIGSNIKSGDLNEDDSQSTDSSLQPPGTSNDLNASDGTNETNNTVESLLVTNDSTDEGTTENIPSSDDTNSEIDDVSE